MTITREELAAYADGELDTARTEEIAAAVESEPELAREVAAHRALKAQLTAHFAPIAEEQVPERLMALLTPRPAEVVDFTAARDKAEARRRLPRWSYFAAPALAASLALALFLPRGGDDDNGTVGPQLAQALDTQLVAEQASSAEPRILLSFRDRAGDYCRAFAEEARSGIACKQDGGWQLRMLDTGTGASVTEYRQASAARILAQAQEMADGPALDAQAEAAARQTGWR